MFKRIATTLATLACLVLSNLSYAEFYASKVAESSYDNAPALVIRFTEAIDASTQLENFVTVKPELDNGSSWLTLDDGYSWTLPFVEPNTTYKVTLDTRLTSTQLNSLVAKQLTRGNSTFKSTHWSVSTKQLTPAASFAQSGQYLTGSLQNELPITAVNLDSVELDIFRVRDQDRDKFLADTFYSGRMYYDSLTNLKRWADLIHTAHYDFDLKKHTRTTLNLDLSPALNQFVDGIYVAVLRKPGEYEYRYDTQMFTQSNIGLHARFFKDEIQLLSNDLTTGEPIEGVEVTYFWRGNQDNTKHHSNGFTDSDGEHRFNTNKKPNLIVAQYNDQVSFIRTSNHQLDLSSYGNSPDRHRELQPFLYGPRDLYRPGEVVKINMILKNYDGITTKTPPVPAILYDARGSRVKNFTWRANNQGHYLYQFTLDENAPTGEWTLDLPNSSLYQGSYKFKVEEFLPERLALSFYDGERQKYRYVDPGNATVPIQADYLYGAPASGNRANGIVTVTAATNLFEQWDEYKFSDPTASIQRSTQQLSDISLNDSGYGELEIPNLWQDLSLPLNYRVTASVFEEGGRPITRSQSVIQLPNPTAQYVGVKRLFKDRPKSNQKAKFHLISVDAQGKAMPDNVSVSLIRKSRDYYWFYDQDNGWNWRYNADVYVAYSQQLKVTEAGTEIELPLHWGDYELEITSGSGMKTVHPFRTQYSWYNANSTSMRPEVIDIILDQDHYAPGETASVQFKSASAGQTVLQVESSKGVLFSDSFSSIKGLNEYKLTIPQDWDRHDYYLSIMVVAASDQVDEVAPQRSLGISHLPLQRSDAVFDVSIDAPEKIEPNTTARAEIKINNAQIADGNKIWATMALVDLGVLNITGYQSPQPQSFFYSAKRFESQYFDMYGNIINNLGYKTYAQSFGGGFDDTDDQLSRGGDKPKSDVQIISYFSQPVEVVNGTAAFEFDIPSFNGRVKWMAVVWSEQAVGSEEVETTIADKLVTQLSMPRFLAMGDSSELTLDLHNLSGTDQSFDIQVQVSGSVEAKQFSQTQALNDQEKQSLRIPIQAVDYTGVGTIRINISNGDDINLNREWTLGTRAPFPIQTNIVRKVIDAQETWQPNIDTSRLMQSTVSAQLTLSDRPAINFGSHLDYLLRYPYGCLEQTTSSTYPWVLIDQAAFDALNLSSAFEARFKQPFTESFRLDQIQKGIDRLAAKQKSDGSFGYWNNSSHSSMWGSVYATDLMVDARNIGVSVDTGLLNQSTRFLSRMLKGTASDNIWTENNNYYQLAYRSYAAMVLAKANLASLSDVRRLYSSLEKGKITQSSLPWMHIAVALKILGDEQRATLAANNALTHTRQGNSYYADYGSSVRDTALTLALAMENDFDYGNLPAQLEQGLQKRRWFSTQERIVLARLGKSYALSGQQWMATLNTSEFNQSIDQAKPFNTLINGEQLSSITSIKASDKKLYASIAWNGVPDQPLTANSNGMHISRHFYDLNGNRIDFSSEVTSGDLIIAKVTVGSNNERFPEALLVDLLPAGFELENQNLLNASVNLDEINIEEQNVGDYFRSYKVSYEEYRDDRYVAEVSLTTWSDTTLFYLVRAVTPGVYSFPNSMIEDMYRPEYFAISETPSVLTVRSAP
ncbi:hypothetical protein KO489_13725 [Reinekea forsetii]|nr:hypothetical protein [Reinekea forsetii]